MRAIKFRAWNGKVMREVYQLHFNGYPIEGVCGCEVLKTDVSDYEHWIITEEVKIMQFTGLKDKNGKEIYEGDRIEIKHPYRNREFTGIVEWLDYEWGCKNFDFGHFDIPHDIFSEGPKFIEVIGNIYL